MPKLNHSNLTSGPIEAADTSQIQPEFCRMADLERLFGIRRSTAYTLLATGKIKTILLRVAGKKSGLRLVHVESVRRFLADEFEAAHGRQPDRAA